MSSLVYLLVCTLEPSTSYSIHFVTQSVSSFRNKCPYHRNLFCYISIMSYIPSLSLNSLLGTLSLTLTLHIHLTILISARWSATSFSFQTGQVSLPCSILLRTQLLYSVPLQLFSFSSYSEVWILSEMYTHQRTHTSQFRVWDSVWQIDSNQFEMISSFY